MRFKKGDPVRFLLGKIDWEVSVVVGSRHYILKSPMSGRHRTAFDYELKPWKPDA